LIRLDDIVTAPEIAQRLNVQGNTVHVWRRRYEDFPQPVKQLATGPIWVWPDVERWALESGRVRRARLAGKYQ
jgi:hypothetical protein